MKKALIMGITGGFGRHVAQSLLNHDWQIKALMRHPENLPEQFNDIEVLKGDATNRTDIDKAANEADVIIYGVNPANYAWDDAVLSMLDNTASVAEDRELTIIFPGNVYIFDPSDGPDFLETSIRNPITSKGTMRLKMEDRLKLASDKGAQVIIMRMGDFMGLDANSTWLKQIIKRTKKGYSLTATGPQYLKHTWANLPDVANTISKLLEKRKGLGPFSEFNFKGYQVSFNDIAKAIQESSHSSVTIKQFPWLIIKLLTPFSALFSGLIEMRYLWNYEINLDEKKLARVLDGKIPHTALSQALLDSGLLKSQ